MMTMTSGNRGNFNIRHRLEKRMNGVIKMLYAQHSLNIQTHTRIPFRSRAKMNCLLASRRRRQRVDAIADHSASAPTVSADKKGKKEFEFSAVPRQRKKVVDEHRKSLFFPLDHSSLTPREMKSVHRRMTRFMISVVWNVCTSVSTWLVCAWSENMEITQASDMFVAWRTTFDFGVIPASTATAAVDHMMIWRKEPRCLPMSKSRDSRTVSVSLRKMSHVPIFTMAKNSFHKNT